MNSPAYLEIIIKSSVIVLLAILARHLIKRQFPSMRHRVVMSALLGAMLIPIFAQLIQYRTNILLPSEFARIETVEPTPTPVSANVAASQVVVVTPEGTFVSSALLLTFFWLIGVAAIVGRYGLGLSSLRTLRSQSIPANGLLVNAEALASRGGISPTFELRISTDPNVMTAMTWGWRRPVILLPADAPTWTLTRLEMILLHEFAHLRRKDFASQMLAEVACALYWFNPIVWLSARAMREDAELAADEAVVAAGIRPSDYASELLQIAATLNPRNRMLNRAGISTMTNPKIESRLKAILSSTSTDRGNTLVNVLVTVAISAIAVAAIASLKVQQPTKSPNDLQTVALSKIKQVSTATFMYASDFDDVLPYVANAKEAQKVIWPYIKNAEVFKSPRAGADFRYNTNIAGVKITAIPSPAEAIMWYEFTPAGINPVVGFVDSHARVVLPDKMNAFKSGLNQKYPRRHDSQPVRGVG